MTAREAALRPREPAAEKQWVVLAAAGYGVGRGVLVSLADCHPPRGWCLMRAGGGGWTVRCGGEGGGNVWSGSVGREDAAGNVIQEPVDAR